MYCIAFGRFIGSRDLDSMLDQLPEDVCYAMVNRRHQIF